MKNRRNVALRKESVDRNPAPKYRQIPLRQSLSARRAWIEIAVIRRAVWAYYVALRKESVDRNSTYVTRLPRAQVALRKESVDRNLRWFDCFRQFLSSLSARRAWIEIVEFHLYASSGGRSPQGERG